MDIYYLCSAIDLGLVLQKALQNEDCVHAQPKAIHYYSKEAIEFFMHSSKNYKPTATSDSFISHFPQNTSAGSEPAARGAFPPGRHLQERHERRPHCTTAKVSPPPCL